jgi:hypothetical protein
MEVTETTLLLCCITSRRRFWINKTRFAKRILYYNIMKAPWCLYAAWIWWELVVGLLVFHYMCFFLSSLKESHHLPSPLSVSRWRIQFHPSQASELSTLAHLTGCFRLKNKLMLLMHNLFEIKICNIEMEGNLCFCSLIYHINHQTIM